jgi:hypothetical protein
MQLLAPIERTAYSLVKHDYRKVDQHESMLADLP